MRTAPESIVALGRRALAGQHPPVDFGALIVDNRVSENQDSNRVTDKGSEMNPRRVHELMQKYFPPVDAASRAWKNIVDREQLRVDELILLLNDYVDADQVLVEVHRKLGNYLAKKEAITFVAEHIGEGEIRIADREFRGCIVIARNGVASGWSNDVKMRMPNAAQITE